MIKKGKAYPKERFENIDDVYKYIEKVRKDYFVISNSSSHIKSIFHVYSFLNHFCCPHLLLDKGSQKDITKYMYCSETNTPPYKGSYEDIPSIWIEKYYLLRGLQNHKANMEAERQRAKMKRENG